MRKLIPIQGFSIALAAGLFGYIVVPSCPLSVRVLGTVLLVMFSMLAIACDFMFRASKYLNEKLAKRSINNSSSTL